MIWLSLFVLVGVGTALGLILVLALCKVSGAYDEQECEDYLRGHYEQVDSWDSKNAIREGGFLSDEDEDNSGPRVTLDHVDEFAESIARGRE